MEKCKIFYIEFKSEKKYFLIDVAMNDELSSHRYYILKYSSSDNYECFRIKHVDSLLYLLEQSGISIRNLDDNQDISKAKDIPDNSNSLEEQLGTDDNNNALLAHLGSYDFKVLEKIMKSADFNEQRRINL